MFSRRIFRPQFLAAVDIGGVALRGDKLLNRRRTVLQRALPLARQFLIEAPANDGPIAEIIGDGHPFDVDWS